MKQQMSGWPTIIKKLKLSLMIYTHTQHYWTREMTQTKRAGIAFHTTIYNNSRMSNPGNTMKAGAIKNQMY